MTKTVYIGMDVHSTNYTLSSYIFEEDKSFATVKLSAETESILKYIRRIRSEYGDGVDIVTGYEAGSLGYTLYNDLKVLNASSSHRPLFQKRKPVKSRQIKGMHRNWLMPWRSEILKLSMFLMNTMMKLNSISV